MVASAASDVSQLSRGIDVFGVGPFLPGSMEDGMEVIVSLLDAVVAGGFEYGITNAVVKEEVLVLEYRATAAANDEIDAGSVLSANSRVLLLVEVESFWLFGDGDEHCDGDSSGREIGCFVCVCSVSVCVIWEAGLPVVVSKVRTVV